MASLDSPAVKGVAITTTPNSAYEEIQKGGGLEKKICPHYDVLSHISNSPLPAVPSPVAAAVPSPVAAATSGGVEVAEDQVVYEPIPGEK